MPKAKRLTAASVERISPPKAARAEHFDAIVPGLALRVTERGSKSWSVLYRLDGRLRRLTIGSYPRIDLTKARKAAREALELVDRGDDPKLARDQTREEAAERRANTVGALADEFVERYAMKRNRAWQETERSLKLHVLPKLADRPLDTVTRADVTRLLDPIMDRGQHGSANRTLAVTRKMFGWAIERGYLENNPAANVKKPGKIVERDRVLTDVELQTIWSAAEATDTPFAVMVKFLLVTAQRRGETSRLRWEHLDLDADEPIWRIPGDETKSGRSHEVPLSPLAVRLLQACPRWKGPFVFTTTGGVRPISGFSKSKRRLDDRIAEARIPDWRLHDLRRTAGTGMAKLAFSNEIIGRVMNHAESGVTRIYSRYSRPEEKRAALDAWAGHLETILGMRDADNVVSMEGRG
ncbi:MAG: integrase arm-type DNA-binding domain-containing protein [Alphaproteobacteria bacterium]|jgi:integrase|nr:integrase arm-type DNA-binding domain-containing protein [Alphaproteobacteria bacterium]